MDVGDLILEMSAIHLRSEDAIRTPPPPKKNLACVTLRSGLLKRVKFKCAMDCLIILESNRSLAHVSKYITSR